MLKITKYMLIDFLNQQNIKTKFFGHAHSAFSSVKTRYDNHCDTDELYFVFSGESEFSNPNVCCIRTLPVEIFDFYDSNKNEIICRDGDYDLYHAVISCFQLYQKWYAQMQNYLLTPSEEILKNIINCSLPLLENPIAVSDIGFQVLAYTENYYAVMQDDESKFIVKNGCHSPEYIQLITQHKSFIKNLKNNLGPFRYRYQFLEHESIYCTIWNHRLPVAYLTIVGMNPFINHASLDITRILATMLSKAFEVSLPTTNKISPTDYLLLRVLKNKEKEPSLRKSILSELTVGSISEYTMLFFDIPIIRSEKSLLYRKIFDLLSAHLPNSKLLTDKDGIAIIHSDKDPAPDKLASLLDLVLTSYPYHIGVSYVFYDLKDVSTYYRQALVSAQSGRQTGLGTLCYYENFIAYDLFLNQLTAHEKKAGIHPALSVLKNFDTKHGANLFNTLKLYLHTHCNAPLTAQKLHVHKNTLYYRLNQIQELTAVSFDNHALCDCLRLSFYFSEIC